MFCWGSAASGRLGLGGIEEQEVRAPRHLAAIPPGTVLLQVACGYDHTLFRSDSGAVYSCGNNDRGQLGRDGVTSRPVLVDALGNYPAAQVAAGDQFSLAVTRWGGLFAWGDNRSHQLGTGEPAEQCGRPRQLRALASSRVVQAACGRAHCLALTDAGQLLAWGDNQHGQLGGGAAGPPRSQPRVVEGVAGLPLARLACGGHHCLALTSCGRLLVWGRNTFHQLGVNAEGDVSRPTPVRSLGSQRLRHIAAGENHSAVLTQEGAVFTFGGGSYGQLGHGTTCSAEVHPRQVAELMGSCVTQLAAGRQHTLVLVSSPSSSSSSSSSLAAASGGRVMAFGLGGSGQLGAGDTQLAKTPQVVTGPWSAGSDRPPAGPLRLAAGGDQSFAFHLPDTSLCDDRLWPSDSLPLELTQSQAESMRRQAELDSEERHRLIEYAETVLGSAACLNGSFLPAGPRHICTSLEPNLETERCRRTLKTLYGVTSDTFSDLIGSRLASVPASLPARPADPECLRVFLVLLCWPGLAQMADQLGDAVTRLADRDWRLLGGWLRLLPAPVTQAAVSVYKEAALRYIRRAETLTQCQNGSWQLGGPLLASLRTLRRLHAALLDSPAPASGGPPGPAPGIADDTFYIPELTELVSVPLDFIGWQMAAGAGGAAYFCDYPFVFDAAAKTQLLQTDALLQMRSAMEAAALQQLVQELPLGGRPVSQFLTLTVSRENLVPETLQQLSQKTAADLRKPLRVQFLGEEAEDAGGVRKEFFLVVTRQLLDPQYGMFTEQPETRAIWFSPDSYEDGVMYFLIGIVCGLAIYNSTIVNLPFPLALYKKLLGKPVGLEDLQGLSPTMAKSLSDLLSYPGDDVAEVFSLTFEVTREVFGRVETLELKEGGGNIPVDQTNKHEYVSLYVDYVLNGSIAQQYGAFRDGFYKVCSSQVLQLFTAPELMTLVTGDENYDWDVFEKNTEYREGYSRQSEPVVLFWKVFHGFSLDEKKRFLLWLTGSDRVPIGGMKTIKMYVQPSRGGETFLPVAHTCFNLLDLPEYSTAERLRYKLLQAMQCTEGFGLA